MKKLFTAVLALLFAATALGQSYPSPTYNNLTVLGSFNSTGNIGLASLASQAANTVVANATGSSASPTAFAMPSCSTSTSALQYTSGTGFTCDTNSASLTGAMFTGATGLSYSNPAFTINDTSGSNQAQFFFKTSGNTAWVFANNSSSNQFVLARYVSNSYVDSPIAVVNSTGAVTMADGITNSPISGSTGSFTTLAASGTVSGTGFANYLASPPAIGGSTANSGTFTNLTASGTLTGFPGRLLNIQVFTSSGTYTPTSGATKALVRAVGGGGAGGSVAATGSGQAAVAGSGSAGGYGEIWISSGLSSQTVTVGASGVAAAAGNNAGGNGGQTSFGTLLVCAGGAGGGGGGAMTPPGGGFPNTTGGVVSGSGATFLVKRNGGYAVSGIAISAAFSVSGNGADSPLGAGGSQSIGAGAAAPSNGYGAGGSGAAITQSIAATAGGNGSQGLVIVYEYQ